MNWLSFTKQKRSQRAIQMERVQWLLGALATLVVALVWSFGGLEQFEARTIDWRARWFWRMDQQPSDKVVVVALDDESLRNVGRWPWEREKLAAVIDELRLAETRVVALDVILAETQQPRTIRVDLSGPGIDQPAAPNPGAPQEALVKDILDDQLLSAAIKRHGGVIVPGSFRFRGSDTHLLASSPRKANEKDATTPADGRAPRAASGNAAGGGGGGAGPGRFNIPLQRVLEMFREDPSLTKTTPEDAITRLSKRFPETASSTQGPEWDELRQRFEQAMVITRRGGDSGLSLTEEMHPSEWPEGEDPTPPLEILARSASRLANVFFDSYDTDSVVRRIPIWVAYDGRLWPTLGVAAAMEYWQMPLSSVKVSPEETVIQQDGIQYAKLETRRYELRAGEFGGLYFINWPRGTTRRTAKQASVPEWQWQLYDIAMDAPTEVAAGRCAEPWLQKQRIATNLRSLRALVEGTLVPAEALTAPEAERFRAAIKRGLLMDTDPLNPDWVAVLAELRALLDAAAKRADEDTFSWYEITPEAIEKGDRPELKVATHEGAIRTALVALRDGAPALHQAGALDDAAAKALMSATDGLDQFDLSEPAWQQRLSTVLTLLANADKALARGADGKEGEATPPSTAAAALATISPQRKAIDDARDKIGVLLKVRSLGDGLKGSRVIREQLDLAGANIVEIRKDLRARLKGKIAFFGWTATGSTADFVATSIYPRTPGVHVHAMVTSAILTGFHKVNWPVWADAVMLLALGLIGTWSGVRSTVLVAPVMVLATVVGWFAITGLIFWQGRSEIVAFCGPAIAAAAGWLAVLLHRLLIEQRDRRSTEQRFKSYVSPAVVDILVNNPSLSSMQPQQKTLTVMFSDVADFTTTAERLGPVKLAKFLGFYLGEMTQVLQANRATLDKYLGDGIMAFWGAPIDDADHAIHGCEAAIAMMQRLDDLNEIDGFGEAGKLSMRIGLASGELMVGDFGNPPRNSAYTVLGDTANLASRLESANKFFGSRIMLMERTRQLIGNRFRLRSLGQVRVKGKKEGEWLYELVGSLSPHGPATQQWIDLTNAMVSAYRERDFDVCLAMMEALEVRFGEHKLCDLYRHAVDLAKANPDKFDGMIVLTEK